MRSLPFQSFVFVLAVAAVALPVAAGALGESELRPAPDESAMREVLSTSPRQPVPYISARSIEHYLRAMLAKHSGDGTAALTQLRLSALYDPRAVFPRFALAAELFRQGHIDSAKRTALEALEIDETHSPSMILLARVALGRGETDEGRRLLERATQADPGDPEPLRRLVSVYVEIDELDLAVSAANRLDALPLKAFRFPFGRDEQHVADALTDVGLALADVGREEESLDLLRRALQRDPHDGGRVWALARMLAEFEHPAQAADLLEPFGRTDPLARAEVLRLRLAAGQREQARAELAALIEALRLDGAVVSEREMRALEIAGTALLRSGLVDRAAPLVHAALASHSNRIELVYLSGAAHEALGNCDAAEAAYARVPDAHGLAPAARARSLACSQDRLESEGAREALGSLVEAYPESPEVLDAAARAWIVKARRDGTDVDALLRAERYATEAVRAGPGDVRLLTTFADVLLIAGKEEQALMVLRRASSLDAGGRSAELLSELESKMNQAGSRRASAEAVEGQAERPGVDRQEGGREHLEMPD